MNTFMTLVVSGLFSGSIYCLIAIGFVVVYKSTKVVNFSQGMLVVLGAFVLWSILSMGVPVWFGVIISFILTMGVSMGLERICMRPLVGQSILASVMVTLALIGGLRGLVLLIWGPQGRKFPVDIVPRGVWELGVVVLPKEKAIALMTSLFLIVILYLFFRYTRTGLGMKVTSEDHFIGQIVGLRISRIFSYSWAIAGFVAAIGGTFLGMIVSIRPELEEIGP
ncbi:MAG: branched-chain amino acid ABC transporter permease [Thermodesulfobacteriota bacterium]|nr:branched-chain amino acid ABC transporter permease [Thermodesulfobacteriota bacterium]